MKKLLTLTFAVSLVHTAFSAVLTVNSGADSGAGSLRNVIASATSGDTLNITASDTLKLTGGEIVIDKDITLTKTGKAQKVISGELNSRIFNVQSGKTLNATDIHFINGIATNGAAISSVGNLNFNSCSFINNKGEIKGGAVYINGGTANFIYCTFEGNSIYNNTNLNTYIPFGGALYNNGVTTIEQCTFDGNSCRTPSWVFGGALANDKTLSITNSTYTNNTVESTNNNYKSVGAAIACVAGTTTITSCTISNNNIKNGSNNGGGIGIYNNGQIVISSSIVESNTYKNTTASDIIGSGNPRFSSGYNLIGTASVFTTSWNDVVGQSANLQDYDFNGGPTKSYKIGCNSPAYGKGKPSLSGTISQNGIARGARVDIGSYAWNGTLPTATINTTSIDCYGAATGTASVQAPNLTYTYNWSNGQSGAILSNVIAGSYQLTITDAASCKDSITFSITQTDSILISGIVSDATAGANGSIDVTTTGGTPNYNFSWSPAGGTQEDTIGVAAGTYTLTVTDKNACTASKTFTVGMLTSTFEKGAFNVNAYPNPSNGNFTITDAEAVSKLTIYDLNGQVVLQASNNLNNNKQLPIGVYVLELELIDGSTEIEKLIVK